MTTITLSNSNLIYVFVFLLHVIHCDKVTNLLLFDQHLKRHLREQPLWVF